MRAVAPPAAARPCHGRGHSKPMTRPCFPARGSRQQPAPRTYSQLLLLSCPKACRGRPGSPASGPISGACHVKGRATDGPTASTRRYTRRKRQCQVANAYLSLKLGTCTQLPGFMRCGPPDHAAESHALSGLHSDCCWGGCRLHSVLAGEEKQTFQKLLPGAWHSHLSLSPSL